MATYDENELDVATGLEYSMDNVDFYKDILSTYLEETADEIKQMDDCLASGDMKNYATMVHAVKSSSRLIGAASLGEDAYDLELKAKADDVEYVKAHHDALKEHVDKVFACINAYMAG